MNEEAVKRLALVMAIQVEVEAMKVYNELNPSNPYMPKDFEAKAEDLRDLAYASSEQLFG